MKKPGPGVGMVATGFELFVWRRMYGESLDGVPRQRKLLTDLFNVMLYVAAAGFIAVEVFDQAPQCLGHGLAHERAAVGVAGEVAQMGMLDLGEAKRTSQGLDRRDGRAHRAPLFEPDVPIDADARELGHLLATQARRASSASRRQADGLGCQALTT